MTAELQNPVFRQHFTYSPPHLHHGTPHLHHGRSITQRLLMHRFGDFSFPCTCEVLFFQQTVIKANVHKEDNNATF